MKHHGPLVWILVIAFGVGGGILLSDGVKYALVKAEMRRMSERMADERAAAAEAAEQARKEQRMQTMRKQAGYQAFKQSYQKRNNRTEQKNQYLQMLKSDCDEAHAINRLRPSRENSEFADETCTAYESEKVLIEQGYFKWREQFGTDDESR